MIINKTQLSFDETIWTSYRCHVVQEMTVFLRLLTEVTSEEESLCGRSPLFKEQAVVRPSLHTEGHVAARKQVEPSLCLFQLEKLLL